MWRANPRVGLPFLMAVAVLQGCNNSPEKLDQRTIPEEFVEGSFVVETAGLSETSEEDQSSLLALSQQIAADKGCKAAVNNIAWAQTQSMSTSLTNTFHLELTNCSLDVSSTDEVLVKLLESDLVNTAKADAVLRTSVVENDQYKSRQYYLNNIRRDDACDLTQDGGKEVVVAVVDSGVQKNHPDLVDVFYKNANGQVIGANFVGKGRSGQPDSNWGDGNGHGTHVAGLVGAAANNRAGIAGVGACQNVKIMPIRAMNDRGQGNSIEIDRAIQWAAANGADIINLSLGSNQTARSKRSSHPSALYQSLNDRGVIVFAAAGNDGFQNGSRSGRGYIYSYPASYDNVIAVGATDSRDRLTGFSVYGDHIDIAAPGQQTLSTYPGSRYQNLSGTSMATPIAAGAYALALSAARSWGADKLYHDEVEKMLMDTVNPAVSFQRNRIIAGGIIDTSAMVESMKERFDDGSGETPTPDPIVPPTPTPNPEDPEEEEPQPEPTPPSDSDFGFVGLQNGQSLTGPVRISVANWPEGTHRVKLYWITGNEYFTPRSFISLGYRDLTRDRSAVTTPERYNLFGTRYLVAEAVDERNRRLEVTAIALRGLTSRR